MVVESRRPRWMVENSSSVGTLQWNLRRCSFTRGTGSADHLALHCNVLLCSVGPVEICSDCSGTFSVLL